MEAKGRCVHRSTVVRGTSAAASTTLVVVVDMSSVE